jgi:hypothetical protein
MSATRYLEGSNKLKERRNSNSLQSSGRLYQIWYCMYIEDESMLIYTTTEWYDHGTK